MFAEFQLLTNCKSASDAREREREKKGEETTNCAAGQIPNAATTSMNGDTTKTARAEEEGRQELMLLIILLVPVNGKLSLRI